MRINIQYWYNHDNICGDVERLRLWLQFWHGDQHSALSEKLEWKIPWSLDVQNSHEVRDFLPFEGFVAAFDETDDEEEVVVAIADTPVEKEVAAVAPTPVPVPPLTSNWNTALSSPPTEYNHLPHLLNFTLTTNSACPLYSLYFDFSLGQGYLNILTLLKSSPVAMIVPSGDRSIEFT